MHRGGGGGGGGGSAATFFKKGGGGFKHLLGTICKKNPTTTTKIFSKRGLDRLDLPLDGSGDWLWCHYCEAVGLLFSSLVISIDMCTPSLERASDHEAVKEGK